MLGCALEKCDIVDGDVPVAALVLEAQRVEAHEIEARRAHAPTSLTHFAEVEGEELPRLRKADIAAERIAAALGIFVRRLGIADSTVLVGVNVGHVEAERGEASRTFSRPERHAVELAGVFRTIDELHSDAATPVGEPLCANVNVIEALATSRGELLG